MIYRRRENLSRPAPALDWASGQPALDLGFDEASQKDDLLVLLLRLPGEELFDGIYGAVVGLPPEQVFGLDAKNTC
jgi:hypothetical protein